MIPILFPPGAVEFKTQGLGALSDAISCTVTEERNGAYELEMQYPMSGLHFDEITDRCIVYAIPSPYRLPQPFRIYRITKPLDGVCTIYAQHISYDLSGVPLNPFTASNAPAAMAGLQSNAAVVSPFKFWTDKSTAAAFSVEVPSSTRSALGGSHGSILDVYGGEYEWDSFTVRLHGQRGQDNGVVIRYGKNLTDIEQDRNIASVATGIYPYWANTDGDLVICDPKIVPAQGAYDFTRVVPVDFSQDFQEAPSPQELKAKAEQYVTANQIGVPKVSITASFVQLEQFAEYEDLALLEKCDLCDTVAIQFERLGVNAKAEIVKIETDVLLERYNRVEIGDAHTNIADTIVDQGQQIKEKPSSGQVEQIANSITNAILGAKGGAVRMLDTDGDGTPDTLYIADNPDPAKAKKVWRFNYEGWGASSNGYNGPFPVAASISDGLYADFITAGTLNAALVKVINLIADHLTSSSGTYMLDIWAAVMKLMDGENQRVSIYTTGVKDSAGIVQVFAGTLTDDGKKDETTRYSYLYPYSIGVGEKQDGTYEGAVHAGSGDFSGAVSAASLEASGTVIAGQSVSAGGSVTAQGNIRTEGTILMRKVAPIGNNELTVDWVRVNTADGGTAWALCGM